MRSIAVVYLGSHFLPLLGNGIAAVALPLAVLQITGSPLSMGVISASTTVPAVVIGLTAGFALDRWNRRNISVVSDLISATAVAALPLVDMLLGLELWWFVLLGLVGSFGDVPGSTAREVLVAAVVERSGVSIERIIGVRQTLTSSALVVGPAVAGTLIAFLGSSAVFFVTAATSAAAALLTLLIPRETGRAPRHSGVPERPLQQLLGGFVVLRNSPFLRATTVLIVGLTTVGAGLQGLVLPLHFAQLARPELLGLVMTAMSAGMLLGATLFSLFAQHLSRQTWLTMGFIALTAGFTSLSTLVNLPVIFVSAVIVGLSNALLGAVLGVLLVEKTPDLARGRVLALQSSALQLAAPLGIGGAGLVAEIASPASAGLAVTGVWIVALLLILVTRSMHDVEREGRA